MTAAFYRSYLNYEFQSTQMLNNLWRVSVTKQFVKCETYFKTRTL